MKKIFLTLVFLFSISHNSYSANLSSECISSIRNINSTRPTKELINLNQSLALVSYTVMQSSPSDSDADAGYKLTLTMPGVINLINSGEVIQWFYSSITFDKNGNVNLVGNTGTLRPHSRKEIKEYLQSILEVNITSIELAEGQLNNYLPNLRNSIIRDEFLKIKKSLEKLKKAYSPCMS